MRTPIEISRTHAANLLNDLRILVASKRDDAYVRDHFRLLFEDMRIPPPTECEGEAHSNGHIDNCALCAPEWGWILQPVKIK